MKVPHIVFQPIHQLPLVRSLQIKTAPFPSFLQHCLQQLLQSLLVKEQIKVIQKRDRAGNSYYQIVDQDSGQTQTFFSETDALIWLDRQRFNH